MPRIISDILGTSIGGFIGLLWLFGILLYCTLPVMALVVTLNIRKIRIALERMSNTAEAVPGWTRTGPLDLARPSAR